MEKPHPQVSLCLLLSYFGDRYNGIQYQRETHVLTIQNVIASALQILGVLSSSSDISQAKWSRAARTDKGVHALCNALSFRGKIQPRFYEGEQFLSELLLKELNKLLPQDLVAQQVFRVPHTFQVRTNVNARTYVYLLPISILGTTLPIEEIVAKANRVCSFFKGSHKFHNYTELGDPKKAEMRRFILSFECQALGPDFIRFQVKGQSFIYNQIRKMVGAVIQVFIEDLPEAFVENTFYNNLIPILLAPPQGLYLKELDTSSFNRRKVPEQILAAGPWLQEFEKKIEANVMAKEREGQVFSKWMQENKVR